MVLGGGGSTGDAWLIGVIAGLFEAGLDVTTADLTIGTSAGSTAAAALDSDAASDGSWQTQWRATVAARLPSQLWPQRMVLITAVDAHTGEPVVFDRHSGVDLADAVAASCASGLPYGIGDRRYIDSGYRSNAENADLAAGYARVMVLSPFGRTLTVLVLSPFGGRTLTPLDWGMDLATQVDELPARGSRVETIFPDSSSEHNLSLRRPRARAGYDQGRALAEQLTELWRGQIPGPHRR